MDIRKKILGAKHPDTLNSIANLAHTYWSQKRHGEAFNLIKTAQELPRNCVLEPLKRIIQSQLLQKKHLKPRRYSSITPHLKEDEQKKSTDKGEKDDEETIHTFQACSGKIRESRSGS